MASKKKRNRPRPPAASRAAKPAGAKPGGARPAGGGPAANGPAANGPAATAKPAGPKPGTSKPAGNRPAAARTPGAKSSGATKQGAAKGPTRAERLAAAEKARRRKAQRTRAIVAGVLVAVVTLITVTVIQSRRSNQRVVSALEASGSCDYDSRSDGDKGQGRNHVNGDVQYEVDPPSGGDHDPSAAGPGIYTVESRPTEERIVHALEHGYVTIWHRPDLAPAALDDLKALAGRYDRDVLLVPRESLQQPLAATAWHRRLLCTQPDVEALERFVTEYRNEGPEKIPH